MIKHFQRFLALALTACLLITNGILSAVVLPWQAADTGLINGDQDAYVLDKDYTITDSDCETVADGATINLNGHTLDLAGKELLADGGDIVISNGTLLHAESFFAAATNKIVLENVTVSSDKAVRIAGSLSLVSSTIGSVEIADEDIVAYAGENYKAGVSNINVDAASVIGRLTLFKLAEVKVDGFVADLVLDDGADYSALLLGTNANVANVYVAARHAYILGEHAFVGHAYSTADVKDTLLSPDVYVRSVDADAFDALLADVPVYSFVSAAPATCLGRGEVVLSYLNGEKTEEVTFAVKASHKFGDGVLVTSADGVLDLYDYECVYCGYKYRSIKEGSFALEDCENVIDLLAFALKDFNYDFTLTPGTSFGDVTVLGGYVHILCEDGKLSGAVLANFDTDTETPYRTLVKGYVDGQNVYGSYREDNVVGDELVEKYATDLQTSVYDALMLLIEGYTGQDIKSRADMIFAGAKSAILAGGILDCAVYDVEYLVDGVIDGLISLLPSYFINETLKDTSFFLASEPDDLGNVTYTLDLEEVRDLVTRLTGKSLTLLIDEELYPVAKGETKTSKVLKNFLLHLPEMTCGEIMDFVLDFADNAGVPANRIFGTINGVLAAALGEETFDAMFEGDVRALLDDQYRDVLLNDLLGPVYTEEGKEPGEVKEYYLTDLTEDKIDTVMGATLQQIIKEATGTDYVKNFLDAFTNEAVAEYGVLSYVKNAQDQVTSVDLALNLGLTANLTLTYEGEGEEAVCTGRCLTVDYDVDEVEESGEPAVVTKNDNKHAHLVIDLGKSETFGNYVKEISFSAVVTDNLKNPAEKRLDIGASFTGKIVCNEETESYAVTGFALNTPVITAALETEDVMILEENRVLWKNLTLSVPAYAVDVVYTEEVNEDLADVTARLTASVMGVEVAYQRAAEALVSEATDTEPAVFEEAEFMLRTLRVTYAGVLDAVLYETLGTVEMNDECSCTVVLKNAHVSYKKTQIGSGKDAVAKPAMDVDVFFNQSVAYLDKNEIPSVVINDTYRLHVVEYDEQDEAALATEEIPGVDKDVEVTFTTTETDAYGDLVTLRGITARYTHNGKDVLTASVAETDVDPEQIHWNADVTYETKNYFSEKDSEKIRIFNEWAYSEGEQPVLLHNYTVLVESVIIGGRDKYQQINKYNYYHFDVTNTQTAFAAEDGDKVDKTFHIGFNFGGYYDFEHTKRKGTQEHIDANLTFTGKNAADGKYNEELTLLAEVERFNEPMLASNREHLLDVHYTGLKENGKLVSRTFDRAYYTEADYTTDKILVKVGDGVDCSYRFNRYGFENVTETFNETAGKMQWNFTYFDEYGVAASRQTEDLYPISASRWGMVLRDDYFAWSNHNLVSEGINEQDIMDGDNTPKGYTSAYVLRENTSPCYNGTEDWYDYEIALTGSILQPKSVTGCRISVNEGLSLYQKGVAIGDFSDISFVYTSDWSGERTNGEFVFSCGESDVVYSMEDWKERATIVFAKDGSGNPVIKSVRTYTFLTLEDGVLSCRVDKYCEKTVMQAGKMVTTKEAQAVSSVPLADVSFLEDEDGWKFTVHEYMINLYALRCFYPMYNLFDTNMYDVSWYQSLGELIANGQIPSNELYVAKVVDGTESTVTFGANVGVGYHWIPDYEDETRQTVVAETTASVSVAFGYNSDPDNRIFTVTTDLGEVLSRFTDNFGAFGLDLLSEELNSSSQNSFETFLLLVAKSVVDYAPKLPTEVLTLSSVKTTDETTGIVTRANVAKVNLPGVCIVKAEADIIKDGDLYTLVCKTDDKTYFAGSIRVNETTIELIPYVVKMQDVSEYGFKLKLEKVEGIRSLTLHGVYNGMDVDVLASVGNDTLCLTADLFNAYFAGVTLDFENESGLLPVESFFDGRDVTLFPEFEGLFAK